MMVACFKDQPLTYFHDPSTPKMLLIYKWSKVAPKYNHLGSFAKIESKLLTQLVPLIYSIYDHQNVGIFSSMSGDRNKRHKTKEPKTEDGPQPMSFPALQTTNLKAC